MDAGRTEWVTVRVPDLPLPDKTAAVLCELLAGSESYLRRAEAIEAGDSFCRWRAVVEGESAGRRAQGLAPLREGLGGGWDGLPKYDWVEHPRVLALVPHWRCERWLPRCLASLVDQTRSLTNIVVLDDGSDELPVEIVRRFPMVTLLSSARRVGPYQLVQSAIEQTNYAAYLFQDADDWSSCDRLEVLLNTARNAGAELVSAQEIRVLEGASVLQSVGYPLDVNAALAQAPGHALIHPASLVTRDLVMRIGGFATGLRFGGDSEFLLRAHWAARIVNSPHYCYFRLKRAGSLTTAAETGLDSPIRKALTGEMKRRAIARSEAAKQQQPLDLRPMKTMSAIQLTHVCGPQLQWL